MHAYQKTLPACASPPLILTQKPLTLSHSSCIKYSTASHLLPIDYNIEHLNQSHKAYIMPLVNNFLVGGHTDRQTDTHIPTYEQKRFQETRHKWPGLKT